MGALGWEWHLPQPGQHGLQLRQFQGRLLHHQWRWGTLKMKHSGCWPTRLPCAESSNAVL